MKLKIIIILGAVTIFVTGFTIGSEVSPQMKEEPFIRLNHIAIRVADFDKTSEFYENTLGFPLAYKFDDEKGNPLFAYYQVNKYTFIELMPMDERHPVGFDHFALETNHLDSLLTHLDKADVEVYKPRVSVKTGVHISNVYDVEGNYFELLEAVKGSELEKVMNSWKK